jgi:hypothetical protein
MLGDSLLTRYARCAIEEEEEDDEEEVEGAKVQVS